MSSSRLPGFYRLSIAERRRRVIEAMGVSADKLTAVDAGALPIEVADGMIENVIGTYALPFAVAVNFRVDEHDVLVPMAIEEPSVVAAASNAARMTRPVGFTTTASPPVMIGQIQITHVADPDKGAAAVRAHATEILNDARRLVPRLLERGGGPRAIEARVIAKLPDASGKGGIGIGPPWLDGGVVVVHLLVDCRDAMGANLVNTLCEALADRVAATHNKGIMNGVDAVLVATGQDWRAVEAGAHAYAARTGVYRPLATWTHEVERGSDEVGDLVGELVMPLAVGTVGGALHNHPSARLALELAGIEHADRLAALAGAAGLATNLAALRALATEGIQRGHMSLHARGVARAAGATGDLVDRVAAELAACGDVKPDRAREVLARLKESL